MNFQQTKPCPKCCRWIPVQSRICPLCKQKAFTSDTVVNSEHWRLLREAALENATLHRMMSELNHGEVSSFEDWAIGAIIALAKENKLFFDKLVDAEYRAAPRPMVLSSAGSSSRK